MIGHIIRMSCAYDPAHPDAPCNDVGGGMVLVDGPTLLVAGALGLVGALIVVLAVVLAHRRGRARHDRSEA